MLMSITELIQDLVGAMFTSNTESGITVAYEDSDGTIDLTVATQSDNNFTTTLKNKLDAIEASATADQSNAEIRTAVEAATDSNVFTDADHSKLNAIEASATADQTNTEIRTAVEAASDSNVFTDADHSKLNAIEASATIIDGRAAYSTQEEAEEAAKDIGCEGYHTHDYEGDTWYMPCEKHNMAEVGPKGGVRKSPKAPKSDTPNPSPKGKGTAKGDASGKTGAKVSAKDRATLQNKADEFNKKYKEKLGYGVTVGMLASVFQRGLGAFNTSHSPNVKSASQWAFARTNAFLYLIKNGRPENAKYTTDYDLLPKKHPKSSK